MKHSFENPESGGDLTPAEASADTAGEAQAEAQSPETAEMQTETGTDAGAEAAVEFGPETFTQAEEAMRKGAEAGDMAPEDRERVAMVADETREIGGALSKFSKTKAGRAVSRVLAGGMIAFSLAAAMPQTAEAGSRGRGRSGASIAEIAAVTAVIAGASILLGGGRASREAVRARERITLEQIRTQRQMELERIRTERQLELERIRSETRIRTEEIRKGIARPEAPPPQQEQAPNIPPPPPPPTPERQPPMPTIDEQ